MAHSEHKEILSKLDEAANNVAVGGLYVHYKQPQFVYKVTGFGVDEDTEEIRVEYQRVDEDPPIPWRRRLQGIDGWLTPVDLDGREISRFKKID